MNVASLPLLRVFVSIFFDFLALFRPPFFFFFFLSSDEDVSEEESDEASEECSLELSWEEDEDK